MNTERLLWDIVNDEVNEFREFQNVFVVAVVVDCLAVADM